MTSRIASYFEGLNAALSQIQSTDGNGKVLPFDEAIDRMVHAAHTTHNNGRKIMFVGNGGSAGIASHMAIDFSKNGGLRALAFNDGPALTCLGNDLGYENVFAKQIEMHGGNGDLLIAISSSGRSVNILNAVEVASGKGCRVLTLSGFSPDNPLRSKGEVNFYVPSMEYGFVELSHLGICHGALDLAMGWNPSP